VRRRSRSPRRRCRVPSPWFRLTVRHDHSPTGNAKINLMADSVVVRTVKEYIQADWELATTPGTHIRLYRGQRRNLPLLPRLFRRSITHDEACNLEDQLIARFEKESLYLLPSIPQNRWDLFSLAQHFGLPTRLSDWTSNPFVGLFFAVERDAVSGEEELSPTVFVYDADRRQILDDREKPELSPKTIRYNSLSYGCGTECPQPSACDAVWVASGTPILASRRTHQTPERPNRLR
jgi:hypothetical protein